MENLLLEIGTEEIPAGYIKPALKALSSGLLNRLDGARITHGEAITFGTPKRLAVLVTDVASKQTSLTTEMTGPPESVSFDDQGKPTVAAIKFAEKASVPFNKTAVKETKKGRYLTAVKTERGTGSTILLKTILPDTILSLPFPKSMRWADLSIGFARPVHSVLALLGKKVITFSFGNLKSGRHTYGHRFMAPAKIKVPDPDRYSDLLTTAYVIADIAERRAIVEKEVKKTADSLGGSIMPDEGLLDIVTNLVEYPVPIAGKFDNKFLELPDKVLITAMREHQKYFAVTDAYGKLMPGFIAVNNTKTKNMNLVAKGHERVLRARLEDARFFYKSDISENFEHWIEKLKGVTFQAKLGSMYDKILRVRQLSKFVAKSLSAAPEVQNNVSRAAWISKADLVSRVVVEFPKLQGVMGKIYAQKTGEPAFVAAAIEDHYLPTSSGGNLPETTEGSILAIADKIDTICGCFSAELIPTGASDPYALRRQSIGILQIMLKNNYTFSLMELIKQSIALFNRNEDKGSDKIPQKVYNFFKDRISHLLAEEGYKKDVIASVTSVSADYPANVKRRVQALESLKTAPDFEPLSIAFKRVVNIIKKSEGVQKQTEQTLDTGLFQDKCEHDLYEAYMEIKNKVLKNIGNENYSQALKDIASIRDKVDAFFDGVMVMAEDKKIRKNRFALLSEIAGLFKNIADFSKIQ
ncbi:MAG: glycine--tRNA ligase subunit beta [Deltaproteobacteria bacterium]|nr:glycine--tRNA ligase subunit beta [Deltaproteobacteria bacterium]